MEWITVFLSSYWVHIVVVAAGLPALKYGLTWMRDKSAQFIRDELEKFRAHINTNPVANQLEIDDALITLFESYIPECITELDGVIQTEISTGKISSLDWKRFGESIWAKANSEVTASAVDYMKASGEKDGKVLAAIIAKKFFMKQAALQKGLIVPHN